MSDEASPFDDAIAAVIEAVADGMNVLLTGPPGAGQSSLTEALVTELSFDRRVVRAVGSRALRHTPFAAVAVLKSVRAGDSPADYRARPPRRTRYTELLAEAAGLAGMFVVERPEFLDPDSASVIVAAAHSARVPVVAVSSYEAPAAACTAIFNDLEPGPRLAIEPLTLAQTHELAQDLLAGPVESEAVARVAAHTAGLYDMVVGMITTGRRSGALVSAHGRWRVAGELVSGDLAVWIEALTAGISGRQRDVLRRIAAGSGDEHPVSEAASRELGTLMDIGLVRERGGRVAPYPPLIADYLQSQRRVMPRAAAPLGAGSRGDLRAALERSRARPDAAADAALSHSIRRHSLAVTEEARAAWLTDPTPSRAIPLLVALQSTGADAAELARVVDETVCASDSMEYALLRVWWASYLGLGRARLDDAFASLASLEREAPKWRALAGAARARLRLARGTDARPDDHERARSGPGAGADLGLGRAVEVDRLVIGGRSNSALELAAELGASVHPAFATALELSSNAALVFEGRVRESIDRSRAGMIGAEESLDLGLIYAHSYMKMLGLVISGRIEDGHRVLNRVLTLGTARALHEPYQVGILDLGVIIESVRAEPARAAVLADTVVGITGIDARRGGLPGMSGFSAQRLQARHDLATRLWSTARYCADTGQLMTAVFAGIASLEPRFVRTHAQQVREWGAATESPLLQTLGRYALLLDGKSPDKLLKVADDFLAIDAGLYFGRARAKAVRAHYDSGDRERGFLLAAETWRLTEFMGPERAGLFSEVWQQVGLSEREAQVAQHAAIPSSREIALELHLSQRTIENYMYSTYRKVGSFDREALGLAANTWLRTALFTVVTP